MFAFSVLSLFLVMWCTGSDSQPVLTQQASASVLPGGTVKISCVGSADLSISDRYVSWYQQNPGTSPRYLLRYHSDSNKHQGSGVPARFSGSKDTSRNTAHLTITGAQAEDEADYYCLTYHGSGSTFQYIFGGGTELTAQGGPTVSPSVTLFPPSKEQMKTKNQATLTCLYDEFYPSGVEIQWLADGNIISEGVDTARPMKQRDGSTYMGSSYLTLSRAEWESHNNYSCKVTHDGKSIEKMVRRSDVPS